MKKILLLSVFVVMTFVGFSQQNFMFSQYNANPYSINPAVAGSEEFTPITLGYKKFYTGLDDSPSIQSLMGHTSINKTMGIGAKIFNVQTGPLSKTGFEAAYAYHIDLGGKANISLGLAAMMYQNYLNKSKLTLENPDDDAVTNSSEKLIVPDASFGAYFYEKSYYAGLAVTNLFGRKVDMMNDGILEMRQVRHYYFNGGYKYEINDEFRVEPSILLQYVQSSVFQFDVGVKASYKKMVSLGVAYRANNAVSFMLGGGKDRLYFGYAYDFVMSNLKNYSNGCHELVFVYRLGEKEYIETNFH